MAPNIAAVRRQRSDEEIMTRSWDQCFNIWLRNMPGEFTGVGAALRREAEKAYRRGSRLEILEVSEGLPFKALEIRGYGIRGRGDFMLYGEHGAHPSPEVNITTVSYHDWTKALLQNSLEISRSTMHEVYTNFIMPALLYVGREYNSGNPSALSSILLPAYEDLLAAKRIAVKETPDAIAGLRNLHLEGRHFDLAFIDPTSSDYKNEYFLSIQKLLRPKGVAYVPVTWWVPNSIMESRGVTESVIWEEKVSGENLEDYLTRRFPSALEVLHFPGAKTLLIKGTYQPI